MLIGQTVMVGIIFLEVEHDPVSLVLEYRVELQAVEHTVDMGPFSPEVLDILLFVHLSQQESHSILEIVSDQSTKQLLVDMVAS